MVDFYFSKLVQLLNDRDHLLNSSLVDLRQVHLIDEKIKKNRLDALEWANTLKNKVKS